MEAIAFVAPDMRIWQIQRPVFLKMGYKEIGFYFISGGNVGIVKTVLVTVN